MRNVLVLSAIISFVSSLSLHAQTPTISLETGILTVYGVTSPDIEGRYEIILKGSDDFSSFRVVSAVPQGLSESINGSYEGSMVSLATGTNTQTGICDFWDIGPSRTELGLEIEGQDISITQDSFYNGECRLNGTLTADGASGTFQCSNFNSGDWTTNLITKTSETTLIAEISFFGGECSYDAQYSLFLMGGKSGIKNVFSD